MVKVDIKKTRGAPGPLGMDADGWCRILTSSNFGNVGQDLRKSIAEMAKRLYQKRSANYHAKYYVGHKPRLSATVIQYQVIYLLKEVSV